MLLFLFHYLNYTIAIVNNFPHVSSLLFPFTSFFFLLLSSIQGFFTQFKPSHSLCSTCVEFTSFEISCEYVSLFFFVLSCSRFWASRLDNHFIKWHKCWILNRYKLWKLCSPTPSYMGEFMWISEPVHTKPTQFQI